MKRDKSRIFNLARQFLSQLSPKLQIETEWAALELVTETTSAEDGEETEEKGLSILTTDQRSRDESNGVQEQ
ncbi:Hypothetical protein NTJ_07450 [Nesidiocoris tenuis]|uniref:Uncharacterized protein n=1 Tax=Nesidiocoris tenuis TaxID=355587 RepID=A0ABN7AQZ4_9HEMI|nr:Hypothetical protein NTJ_07450 [Nesidiocoris tenuis]